MSLLKVLSLSFIWLIGIGFNEVRGQETIEYVGEGIIFRLEIYGSPDSSEEYVYIVLIDSINTKISTFKTVEIDPIDKRSSEKINGVLVYTGFNALANYSYYRIKKYDTYIFDVELPHADSLYNFLNNDQTLSKIVLNSNNIVNLALDEIYKDYNKAIKVKVEISKLEGTFILGKLKPESWSFAFNKVIYVEGQEFLSPADEIESDSTLVLISVK